MLAKTVVSVEFVEVPGYASEFWVPGRQLRTRQSSLMTLHSRTGLWRSKGLRVSDQTAGWSPGRGRDPSPSQALKMMR